MVNDDRTMTSNLLKDGANPNIVDSYQYTPLGLAIQQNHMDIAKLILKFSEKINFKTPENSRILLLAIEKLNIDLTEDLLRQGCDPNLARDTKSGENCLHLLMYKLTSAIDDEKRAHKSRENRGKSDDEDAAPVIR